MVGAVVEEAAGEDGGVRFCGWRRGARGWVVVVVVWVRVRVWVMMVVVGGVGGEGWVGEWVGGEAEGVEGRGAVV